MGQLRGDLTCPDSPVSKRFCVAGHQQRKPSKDLELNKHAKELNICKYGTDKCVNLYLRGREKRERCLYRELHSCENLLGESTPVVSGIALIASTSSNQFTVLFFTSELLFKYSMHHNKENTDNQMPGRVFYILYSCGAVQAMKEQHPGYRFSRHSTAPSFSIVNTISRA